MLLFGLGYTGQRQPFATEVVIPPGSTLPRDAEFYQELAPGRIQVTAVTDDRAAAIERLENLETDLVVVAPENATEQLRKGEQTEILVGWNQVDPDLRRPRPAGGVDHGQHAECGDHPPGGGRGDRPGGERAWPAGREPVAGRDRRAHHGQDPERRAHRAQRPQLLRSGGARARHPAPGHHPQLAVDGARATERPDRPVPGGAGECDRGADRQVRGLRPAQPVRDRRGGRADDLRAAGSRC